jgi:hypothetical protein
MPDTFNRDEIANYGKTAAEEIEETPAEETAEEAADETADEVVEAVEQAVRPVTAEREQDEEEPVRRFTDQLPPIADEPMPDLSDPDIAFDNDKFREKMKGWVKTQGRLEARRMLREEEDTKLGQKIHQSIEAKVAAFEKDHPDFKEKVRENKVLIANQLHPAAGQIVARSKYTAELLYRFGNDTALAIRTAQQNPIQQGIIIDRLITEIEVEKAKTKAAPQSGQRQPTLTRKGPASRDEALSGKQSMADVARESRENMRKRAPKFYK